MVSHSRLVIVAATVLAASGTLGPAARANGLQPSEALEPPPKSAPAAGNATQPSPKRSTRHHATSAKSTH